MSGVTFCVVCDTMRAPVSVTRTCSVEPWTTSFGVGDTIVKCPVDASLVRETVGVGEFDDFGDPPPHAVNTSMTPIIEMIAMRFILCSSLSDRLLEIAPQQLSRLGLRPYVEPIRAGRKVCVGNDMTLRKLP